MCLMLGIIGRNEELYHLKLEDTRILDCDFLGYSYAEWMDSKPFDYDTAVRKAFEPLGEPVEKKIFSEKAK